MNTAPRGSRRELAIAVLCCLGGATAVLTATGQAWVHARATQGPLQVPFVVRGGSAEPAAPALAVVGLAGALALLATRGIVRATVGALIAASGIGAAAVAARGAHPGTGSLADRAGAALGTGSAQAQNVAHNAWPAVAIVGAAVFAVGGALAMVRGRSWPGMSARYNAPSASGTAAAPGRPTGPVVPDDALEQWRALDRGEDPSLWVSGEST